MGKMSVTIDVSKIDKSRITDRKYQDKEGNEHVAKEYQMDVVELREPKVIKETNDYVMKKTHFVAQSQTKEERDAKADTVFIGDGITFSNGNQQQTNSSVDTIEYPEEDINTDDIPF